MAPALPAEAMGDGPTTSSETLRLGSRPTAAARTEGALGDELVDGAGGERPASAYAEPATDPAFGATLAARPLDEPCVPVGAPNAGPRPGSWAWAHRPAGAGDVIAGKYALTRVIGRGGMGAVWLAHNLPLDIDVAVKLIRRDRATGGAAERLLQEARAVARLKHSSIVRIFDYGESAQGDPFIVMELLHGESLAAILRREGRLEPIVAAQMLLPVASALVSAHAKGVVHRDLKPDNILLVNDEAGALVPKVVDFGIAKLLDGGIDRAQTLAGEVFGSPDYMSPEQARGAELVGEATDVWALSVVVYETVTGRRPFEAPDFNALILRILTQEPAPIAEHGVDDASLWDVLRRGLAKDPAARFPTMRELGAALASWALRRGATEDASGNPIARHWLSAASPRLLTVYPETEPHPGPTAEANASQDGDVDAPTLGASALGPARATAPASPASGTVSTTSNGAWAPPLAAHRAWADESRRWAAFGLVAAALIIGVATVAVIVVGTPVAPAAFGGGDADARVPLGAPSAPLSIVHVEPALSPEIRPPPSPLPPDAPPSGAAGASSTGLPSPKGAPPSKAVLKSKGAPPAPTRIRF